MVETAVRLGLPAGTPGLDPAHRSVALVDERHPGVAVSITDGPVRPGRRIFKGG
jgi:hypothetical protein